MEREVGGGIGMGNTCKPLAVSFQCMTKSTTNKKKKIKNKKKNKKKDSMNLKCDHSLQTLSRLLIPAPSNGFTGRNLHQVLPGT